MFTQITVSIKLKETFGQKQMATKMSDAINRYFLYDEKLNEFHTKNFLKGYCVSGLYPVTINMPYIAGRDYKFQIRFIDSKLAVKFVQLLYGYETPLFEVKGLQIDKKIEKGKIKTLYTLTPAVITIESCHNLTPAEFSKEIVKNRIISNTIKKYKLLINDNVPYDYDFIEDIELLNKVGITFEYKKGCIIANKYLIHIKKDDLSQKLSNFLLGAGVLEKNSLTFGFCSVKKYY